MELSPEVFKIDCAAVSARLEAFIRGQMEALGREGILVPLSGGLDSSAVAALCARAVGKERVTALALPDLRGSPAALRYARLVSRALGLRLAKRDLSLLNWAAGSYRFVANAIPSRRLLAPLVK